ncbi:hypothetical protein GIB67_023074 [Kingdonia uniflora]|uniref:Glycosyltransferases n=1 Tax=Kingdonia uniflora TaxID=39325 RepID=A0A7J7P8T3_9MAGN|nr:hypothetical protein GIB67_023074 [Kingdonia uniflora]
MNVKDRGVHQRNTVLEHIGRHKLDGIVYFVEDDNIYSLELFESLLEIRKQCLLLFCWYLIHLGYEVIYVGNMTDIDDKIIKRANLKKEDPLLLSNEYCQKFMEDMADLQCLPSTHEPRVSTHMDQIKQMIVTIIDNGYAYEVEGDVYFSVDKISDYGRLSRQKVAKPSEPSWDSPWSSGRPGWHIECSAISAHYLTSSFDMHGDGGGTDLIFPHHENEIAQSSVACSKAKVSYWMHNGHMTKDGKKMSKSLGNVVLIREANMDYHPLVVRYFLMSAHNQSHMDYTKEQLEIASDSVYYIYQTLHDSEKILFPYRRENAEEERSNSAKAQIASDAQNHVSKLHNDFECKISNDLHTPEFLKSSLQDALRFINNTLDMVKKKKSQPSVFQSLDALESEIKELLKILGLLWPPSYLEILESLKEKALKRANIKLDYVLQKIEERVEARKHRDYLKADEIRQDLASKSIIFMDEGEKTVWRLMRPSATPQ